MRCTLCPANLASCHAHKVVTPFVLTPSMPQQSASEAAVAAASVLHSAEDTLYSETKAMHEATQEGVADYLADIATQNEVQVAAAGSMPITPGTPV